MRRMMIKESLLWIILSLAMTVGQSCTKSEDEGAESVRFSMSSPSDDATRTEYSGEGTVVDGNLVKERINWKINDLVTVYSPEATLEDGATHTADYKVGSSVSVPDDLTSRATSLTTTDGGGRGLLWAYGTNHFYAMYPSKATSGFTSDERSWVGLDGTTMKGTIPSTQVMTSWSTSTDRIVGAPDMKYAWMFAKQTADKGSGDVSLVFHPKFTAFEFTVSSGENTSVTLSSFKLETMATGADAGDFVAGDFSFEGSDETFTFVSTGASKAINLAFPSGTVVTPGKSITFTILALPVNLTKMKITFTGTEIGTRELPLTKNGVPIDFTACKKYRIKGLKFPSLLTADGEDILWDYEAWGEDINWDDTLSGEDIQWDN